MYHFPQSSMKTAKAVLESSSQPLAHTGKQNALLPTLPYFAVFHDAYAYFVTDIDDL